MASLEENQAALIHAYGPLVGKKVEYRNFIGEIHRGTLVSILVNTFRNGEPEAAIRRPRRTMTFMKKTENVPLSQLITRPPGNIPYTHRPQNRSNNVSVTPPVQTNPTRDPSVLGDTYTFHQRTYVRTTWDHFEIGDEVAWTLEGQPHPFMGKVKFIGEYDSSEGYPVIEAIVQFDQSTSHLPGYISRLPANRNMVNVGELQTLSRLISKMEEKHPAIGQLIDLTEETIVESNNTAMNLVSLASTSNPHNHPPPSAPAPDLFDLEVVPAANNANDPMQGIQGGNNSCYIDATLYALFAYSTAFDHAFQGHPVDNQSNETKLKSILANDIIAPLREKFFVPRENVAELRKFLGENVNSEYRNSMMDMEEFLTLLLQLMNIPELFEYNTGEKDYIHQIIVPMEMDIFSPHQSRGGYKSLQRLIEQSFTMSEVKLKSRPRNAFIIKMPVSNGQLIGCSGVVPNLTLNLDHISVPEVTFGDVWGTGANTKMSLSAVICLKRNHFVAFVRSGTERYSPWIFMDSLPSERDGKPFTVVLDRLSEEIEISLEVTEWSAGDLGERTGPECRGFKLFTDAYMCIYV